MTYRSKKGGIPAEKQIIVQCQFGDAEDLQKILQQSFDLFVSRILAEH